MKKILIIGGTIILAAAIFIILLVNQDKRSSLNPTSQTINGSQLVRVPDFHLQDYNGKTVSLADFAGKPVIINSWAAWCPFCRKELVDFAAAQKEFGDKVAIVAIDRTEPLNTAKKYTDELGVTKDMIFLLDPSDGFYQSIGGFSMPETIFVDSDGDIVFHKRGPMNIEEISERIQQLLR